VASGTKEDIALFNQELDAQDIPNKLLLTSHAFHSFMMEPILDSFKDEIEKIKLSIPRLPIISTATGTWLTDTEATSSSYWVSHLKNTVRFADAMDTAFELEDYILLEVGPGQTLITLARQQAAGKVIPAFSSINFPKEEQDNEYSTLLNTVGELWAKGISPDWKSFYNEQQRQKIELPGYVFDRKPCWIEPLNVIETIVQKSTVSDIIPNIAISAETESVPATTKESRKDSVLVRISEIITEASGITYDPDSASNTFLELGLDSLSLTQLSGRLKKEFDLPITFRQLNEGYPTPLLLADYIDLNLPEENEVEIKETEIVSNQTVQPSVLTNEAPLSVNQNQTSLEQIIQQIQLLSQKVDQLQGFQSSSANGSTSFVNLKVKHFDALTFNPENRVGTNGSNGAHKKEKAFDLSKINGQLFLETNSEEKKYTIMANEPPIHGSKLGRDENGNPAWFIEDPVQKGKFNKTMLLESDKHN
jgi:acyl transferase domain-containing protein